MSKMMDRCNFYAMTQQIMEWIYSHYNQAAQKLHYNLSDIFYSHADLIYMN